jgi:vancomycin resistance protein YoaR
MKAEGTHLNSRGSVVVGLAVLLLVMSGGLVGAYFFLSNEANATAKPAAKPAPAPAAVAKTKRSATVTVHLGDRSSVLHWADLGGEKIDEGRALAVLRKLKGDFYIAPREARMDLEARKIYKEKSGLALDVYASLGALEAAHLAGKSEVDLIGVEMPARRTVKDLGVDDISTILGEWRTRFAIYEKSRNYNLKLAASKLHGYVMKPGELFSFNDVVGARSYEKGYKIAHVISAGEMVDGLAGGTCQISTTLHGAAFFGGIEIVSSRTHSRPSTYMTMGLDATVSYPSTDLKLRNNYDFPVVIYYKVARGEAVVRILGKKKVYDKIAFERVIRKEIPFDTVTREDDNMPVGSAVVAQQGFPGYKLVRYRRYYRDGKEVKKDKWLLRYAPVTEYVRTGTNPDPNLPKPKQKKGHGPRVEGNTRIVR